MLHAIAHTAYFTIFLFSSAFSAASLWYISLTGNNQLTMKEPLPTMVLLMFLFFVTIEQLFLLGETIDPTSTPDPAKLLRCMAGHQNDDVTMSFTASTVVWIKDGETVEDGGDITISTSMAANGEVSSTLQIASFQESNVGVYQCIFTDDSSSDGEIITTIPLRLDTG